MKFGVALARCNPAFHVEVAVEADRLGFESVWMAEHLAFPVDMSGSPHPGEDTPPVPPSTPVFDAFVWLAHIAGRTSRVRLGTNVYLLGLRHPFVAARAIGTLDIASGIGETHLSGVTTIFVTGVLAESCHLVVCRVLYHNHQI